MAIRIGLVLALCACGRVQFSAERDAARSDASGDASTDAGTEGALDYRGAVLADAPVGYWRLGDTGVVARDELGQHDGSYLGTCTQGAAGALADDPDTAVVFDGASCEVSLPDAFGFTGMQPFTIEAWVAPASGGNAYQHVFTREVRGSGPIDGYALLLSSTAGLYLERVVATVNEQSPSFLVTIGPYVHVVVAYDGANDHLYIDGQEIDAGLPDPGALAAIAVTDLIGATSQGNFFDGAIDEVAIYDHVLASPRIALHHQLGVSGP